MHFAAFAVCGTETSQESSRPWERRRLLSAFHTAAFHRMLLSLKAHNAFSRGICCNRSLHSCHMQHSLGFMSKELSELLRLEIYRLCAAKMEKHRESSHNETSVGAYLKPICRNDSLNKFCHFLGTGSSLNVTVWHSTASCFVGRRTLYQWLHGPICTKGCVRAILHFVQRLQASPRLDCSFYKDYKFH